MITPSTFSIVAYGLDDSSASRLPVWGVAVASKFPAVGAVVPWAAAAAGAVATQAYANTSYGPAGLDLMRSGCTATETLQRLLANDPDREQRQIGLVDATGNSATHTGRRCFSWAGGISGTGFAVQGNILAGEDVIRVMADRFQSAGGSLVERLYAALLAGDRAGGDRRGRQSAAILVVKQSGGYAGFNDRWIDYRVDDHPDPVARLGELLAMHDLYFGKSPVEDRVKLDGTLVKKVQLVMKRLGYYTGQPSGNYDLETQAAFRAWTGNENFEERCDPVEGWIDQPVLHFLLNRFEEKGS
jgi:uncharacterized Ntn-hydrolase superfamily protein